MTSIIVDTECVARFVLRQDWIRADGTIRQDAFLPPKDLNLSVTRHRTLSEDEIWSHGNNVIKNHKDPKVQLVGRADIDVGTIRRQNLDVVEAWQEKNPEHAHIVNWPNAKPDQKKLALELAAAAKYSAYTMEKSSKA